MMYMDAEPYTLGSANTGVAPSFMNQWATNYLGGPSSNTGNFGQDWARNYLSTSGLSPTGRNAARSFTRPQGMFGFTPQVHRYYLDQTMTPPQAPTWGGTPYFRPMGYGQY